MLRDIVAVVGPTCTGKGAVARAVGRALGGPATVAIIACDSVKIYRGADVGTAKPSQAEREGFDYYMLDVAAPGDSYSAGRYMTEARTACEAVWGNGKIAVVAGGTGLYFRALVDGIGAAPPANVGVRTRLRGRAAAGEDLYGLLTRVDPDAAARVSPADTVRIIRALEVYELTGTPLSVLNRRGAAPLGTRRLAVFALDGPRPWLAARIAARTERMLAQGLRAETERLLTLGLDDGAPPLNAIGYKEVVAALDGNLEIGDLAGAIARATRQLAKRQRTWFRAERRAVWLDATAGPAGLAEIITEEWVRLPP